MKTNTKLVLTNNGHVLVQYDDPDSQWGFGLADDTNTWDGGFGIADSWEEIEPRNKEEKEFLETITNMLDECFELGS